MAAEDSRKTVLKGPVIFIKIISKNCLNWFTTSYYNSLRSEKKSGKLFLKNLAI